MRTFIFDAELELQLFESEIHINKLYSFDQRVSTNNHIHSYIELHYNTTGSSVFALNFEKQLELKQGEWLLLGKNVYHEEIIEAECSGYCLGIEIYAPPTNSPLTYLTDLIYHRSELDPEVGALLNLLIEEAENQKLGYEESCKNLFSLLLIQLIRSCTDQLEKTDSSQLHQNNMFMTIDAFFNRIFHYEKDSFTIDDLSDELHMSSRHVSRILQKYYGMTFQQMLLSTKVKFAEYQLRHTDKSIAEISEACDLSEAYLIRSFRNAYGMTPAQYRKQYIKDMI